MMCFSLLKQPIIRSKNGYTLSFEILFLVTKTYVFGMICLKFEKALDFISFSKLCKNDKQRRV